MFTTSFTGHVLASTLQYTTSTRQARQIWKIFIDSPFGLRLLFTYPLSAYFRKTLAPSGTIFQPGLILEISRQPRKPNPLLPLLHTAPSLELRVVQNSSPGDEKTIGFCSAFTFSSIQGQRAIHVVDTPFPAEISQGASPSFVRGTLTFFMPKGSTLESAGLVPYRQDGSGNNYLATSDYITLRLYDRSTQALVYSVDNCKVGNFSVVIAARQIVQVQAQFDGMWVTPGLAL